MNDAANTNDLNSAALALGAAGFVLVQSRPRGAALLSQQSIFALYARDAAGVSYLHLSAYVSHVGDDVSGISYENHTTGEWWAA
jgi:hypothetical protein